MIELPRSLADRLIAHARDAAPHEACGVAGVRDGRVEQLISASNASTRPQVHFTFADDGYLAIIKLERDGLEPAIYHSHPASPAYPSSTDRAEMSATWPDCLQLMISLRHGLDRPELHAYRIAEDGSVREEILTLID